MTKEELQSKVNELLVGQSTDSMYKLSNIIKDNFQLLGIDNSKGYFSTSIYGFDIAILFKRRSFVSFTIKRKKAEDQTKWFGVSYVVKEVIVNDDFVDYQRSERIIHDKFAIEAKNNYRLFPLDEIRKAYKTLREAFPNKKADELQEMVSYLNQDFWLAEDLESEVK